MIVFSTAKIILAALLLIFAQLATAQPTLMQLSEGKLINAKIAGTDKHRFNISLEQNQFAKFQLIQKGLDLKLTTLDPQGNKIQAFDLTSNFGEELATITTEQSGNYAIEVQPFADSNEAFAYSLELVSINQKALTPAGKVDQYLARWDSATSPGLAIAVIKNGKLVHSNGFGLANLEYNIPITAQTVFDVASISKQFTAFSILLLADEGKLSLEDSLKLHLPELPSFTNNITIKHLLHHTSGLREENVLQALAGRQDDDIATQAAALSLLKNQQALNFEPGETFEYSNSGYFLLAQIVGRVSGKSFEAFTKQRIFQPLGMTNSAFPSDHRELVKNRANSYRIATDGFMKSVLNSNMVGSTGLTTTVEDLGKWASNFEQPKVGNLSIIKQMKTTGIFNNGGTTNYAFGQTIDNFQGVTTFGHGGTIAGFKTYLLRIPSENLTVVVLANLPYINPLNTAYEIAEFYMPMPTQISPTTNPLSIQELDNYIGEFEILGGISYTITRNKKQLYVQIMGGAKQPLTHLTRNEFSFGNDGRKLRLEKGEFTMLEGIYGGQSIVGKPAITPSPINPSVDLAEFTGRFYSPELKTSYDIVLENGQLKAQNLRNTVFLTTFGNDLFSGNTGYFLRAFFNRNHDANIIGFDVSGTLISKVKFIKIQ
ncbi:MAG: serine hydrolase domain-containing protein [Paraglaciecola sp.]|uniref:serine hydrolase domain-containing protein n=1 Tax=Paraglaciecola sp. TaxID=1920173 RepID=UPI00329819C2